MQRQHEIEQLRMRAHAVCQSQFACLRHLPSMLHLRDTKHWVFWQMA